MDTIEETDKQAYDQAIRWLTRRAYGTWELQQRLVQSGVAADVVERVCTRCQALGYLDDAAFALSRARYRLHHGRYGPRRVWAELRALQIEDEQIQKALDFLLEEEDLLSLAMGALAKRFGVVEGQADAPQERIDRQESKRRYDFLARRGFNDSVIWQVLK